MEISFRQLTLGGSLNPSLNKLARNKRDTGNVPFLIATSSDWLGLAAAATTAPASVPGALKIIFPPFLAALYDYFSVISALLFEKTIITCNVSFYHRYLLLASCLHFCVSLSGYNCDDVLLRIF